MATLNNGFKVLQNFEAMHEMEEESLAAAHKKASND